MNEKTGRARVSSDDCMQSHSSPGFDAVERAAPGKLPASSLPAAASVQRKARAEGDGSSRIADWQMDSGLLAAMGLGAEVQRKGAGSELEGPAALAAGARGISGPASALPHGDAIQRSFGRHDVSGIQAHLGSEASAASMTLGAEAYASGQHVAFSAQPSLHTAAHEAAHVVQQRAGLSLKGGVGQAGDAHEKHADAVADRVVRGESAEGLLDAYAGGATSTSSPGAGAVQKMRVDDKTRTSFSDGGKLAVVGHRTKELYAAKETIEASNQLLETQGARIRLTAGAQWSEAEGLFKVIPEIVNDKELSKGVSDSAVHSILSSCQPVSDDSEETRGEKTKRYQQFWKSQHELVLLFAEKLKAFESTKALLGSEENLPDPGYTAFELRAFMFEQKNLGGKGEAGSFFGDVLLVRSLLGPVDDKVSQLTNQDVSKEEITSVVLDKRKKEAEEARKKAESKSKSKSEGVKETDEVDFDDDDDFGFSDDEGEDRTDLKKFPPGDLEYCSAKEQAYVNRLAKRELWGHAAVAAKLLHAQLDKTLEQIAEEIKSDGDSLIGPKRCSDMTRFLYAGKDLKEIPFDQAGGRVHHAVETEAMGRIFHSAGVIMQDGDDLVTLEAADGSGALPIGRGTWWFQMYSKTGEMSFAEQTTRRWKEIV